MSIHASLLAVRSSSARKPGTVGTALSYPPFGCSKVKHKRVKSTCHAGSALCCAQWSADPRTGLDGRQTRPALGKRGDGSYDSTTDDGGGAGQVAELLLKSGQGEGSC